MYLIQRRGDSAGEDALWEDVSEMELEFHWSYSGIAEWVGLEETLKTTHFQPPARGRDTFH